MISNQRILIEGVGGIGGVIAAELIRAGYDLTLVTNNPRITAAITHHGLRFSTPEEDQVIVPAAALTTLDELPDDALFDAAYLMMKANAVVAAARQTLPHLQPDAYMVSFQNGIVEEAIAAVVGSMGRVISASVAFGSNMEALGVYRRTSPGQIFIGEWDGQMTPRLNRLKTALSHVIPTRTTPNIVGILWGKLCWNCAVSGLCAVSGMILGDLFATRTGRLLFLHIMREVMDTAHALGLTVEPGVIDYAAYYPAPEADLAAIEAQVSRLGDLYHDVKPSSLQSLERGRPTETEFLNGYVIRRAAEAGVDAPLNRLIASQIAEIEAGTRAIAPTHLDELAALLPELNERE